MDPTFDPYADEVEAYAVSDEAAEQFGIIHLDGKPVPIQGQLGYVNLATFAPRFTIGDPTEDSDQVLSVWTQNDWTGGGQIADLNELSDAQRFRHATAETRYPRMLTLPLETVAFSVTGSTGNAYPIGDYAPDGDKVFYAAFGTNLRHWDGSAFVDDATLTAAPVNKGIVYDGLLWIPQGASGYDTWDGTNVVHSTAIQAVSMVEWDDKIVALGADGQCGIWDGVAWDLDDAIRLRGDRTPRNLVVWWTQNRDPAVYIVTDRDVWVIDPLIPTLYRTGLQFPRHPDQGLGSAAWRDDAMYVSVGVGVHQLSLGGVVSAMGLDRGDGLPSYLRGKIVDLEPEYNGLLALVEGVSSVVTGSDDALGPKIEETLILDESPIMPVASQQARSTLQRWTGTGWHTVWESPGASGAPTRVMVSEGNDDYCLWWGYGGQMYRQGLRRTFHNPKQGAQLGIDRFATSADLWTGRFDANMEVFRKVASHLEAELVDPSDGTVDVYYQTDGSYPDWTLLGQLSGQGIKLLAFDPDGDDFPEGQAFRWIEFNYKLASTDATKTPIVRWISLKMVKVPIATRSWRATVPLEFDEQWLGRGPREVADHLDDLTATARFYVMKNGDRSYRVRMAQVQGPEGTGVDLTGSRVINMLQLGRVRVDGTVAWEEW